MRLTVLFMWGALAACAGEDTSSDEDDDDGGFGFEADADTDADSDANSDSDTDTDPYEGDVTAGYQVFLATCGASGCHGSDGSSGPAPNMQGTISLYSEASLEEIILYGSGEMPPQDLTDKELADVIAFLKVTYP